MSFLTAAQSAAIRLVGRRPQGFFSSTDTLSLEICDLANEVARDIMRSHDWRRLMKVKEITGDGSETAFDLPDDFDRMPIKASVFRPSWNSWHYAPAQDLDHWQDLLNGAPTVNPGYWIILDGQMQIYPAIPNADTARYYYISANVVESSAGTAKPAFTADTDTFLLGDDLLTLGLVWKWRAQKRMEYAEDLANYEKAFAERSGRDKGPRILAEGRPRINADAGLSYPWPLGGI